MEFAGKFRQRFTNGTLAGADLDQGLGVPRLNGSDNLFDYRRIGQKVLAEAFARPVAATHTPAIFAAKSTAAIMLPASALPVPAISSAVP